MSDSVYRGHGHTRLKPCTCTPTRNSQKRQTALHRRHHHRRCPLATLETLGTMLLHNVSQILSPVGARASPKENDRDERQQRIRFNSSSLA
jgi:hypothetical protein